MTPKKTVLSFTHADGRKETRTTDKPYTYVIVGCVDLIRARAMAREQDRKNLWEANWNYYQTQAHTPIGVIPPGRTHPVSAISHDEGKAVITLYGTMEAYIEAKVLEDIDIINRQYGIGLKSLPYVLKWCLNRDHAKAHLSHFSEHADVSIFPIDQML